MKRLSLFSALIALMTMVSCSSESDKYLAFLYKYMPLPDSQVYSQEWWSANVDKTLEVRDRMDWDIPEREFQHFVLPLRVNNEALDDFRLVYADSLCARVEGMTMSEAALEVNHWCHERATYKPSDARTSSPLATIRSGLGRCGEESVLAVAAMRAVGIPSRQVYTPRWAHTDDNHAWIEVYVDGQWHFMGACEPEPVLDLGWFNAPVSRAMLLHTKVFGDYRGDEDVISRTKVYTEINVIKGYVPSRKNVVKVVDAEGNAVKDATVEFKIYNYAEYYTVASYQTDAQGCASLNTGIGDLMIWASKGERFGMAVAGQTSPSSAQKADDVLETTVVLDHVFGEEFVLDFDIEPPVENPIPSTATEEQTAANAARLAQEDIMRAARPHGNGAVLDAFRAAHADAPEMVEAILASLSAKDMNDVSAAVLEDAFAHAGATFEKYLDCPRIELEFLYPYFDEIGKGLELAGPREAWSWTLDNIAVDDESNPQVLRIPPVFVWRNRVADSHSREIFYVALCRSLGFEARIDEVTGKLQYCIDGQWNDVKTAVNAPQGTLALDYTIDGLKSPEYYTHFTLASLHDGTANLLTFDEEGSLSYSSLFSEPYSLDAGNYMLTTGRRLASGGVLSEAKFFTVDEGNETDLDLIIRSSDSEIAVLGTFDAEKPYLPVGASAEKSILSSTGRGWFIVAVLGTSGDEPSNHALHLFEAAADDINEWGHPVVLLRAGSGAPISIPALDNAIYGFDADGKVAAMLRAGVDADSTRLPVIIVGDSFGRIVYYSQGYNTSLAEDLRSVLPRL